jgi:putative transposon-encoded protein
MMVKQVCARCGEEDYEIYMKRTMTVFGKSWVHRKPRGCAGYG